MLRDVHEVTCRSFTTCFTLGTLAATFSAWSRLACEFTSPVSVTTPLFTSYFTLSCILFWISAASRFPDVSDSIRKSLDQAGFKDVTVGQDRDKGIVTLGGQVASDNDKSQAESLAKSLAGAQVVANQIAVVSQRRRKRSKGIQGAFYVFTQLVRNEDGNLSACLVF
jgi:BON domain